MEKYKIVIKKVPLGLNLWNRLLIKYLQIIMNDV